MIDDKKYIINGINNDNNEHLKQKYIITNDNDDLKHHQHQQRFETSSIFIINYF